MSDEVKVSVAVVSVNNEEGTVWNNMDPDFMPHTDGAHIYLIKIRDENTAVKLIIFYYDFIFST